MDYAVELIGKMPNDFDLIFEKEKGHVVILRGTLSNGEEAHTFLEAFEKVTDTHWISYRSLSEPERCIFSKKWVCQHHEKNKSTKSERNLNCKAFVDIKIKIVSKDTKTKDAYLKRVPPLRAVISINLEHSHPIRTADMFRMLRVTNEVREKFHHYFSIGMGATEASLFHESTLLSQGEITSEMIASSAVNPTNRQVKYLHDVWKKTIYGPAFDPLEKLIERCKIYEENGATVKVKGSTPWAVLIVTSVMKRAQQLSSSQETIFIDSTTSCDVMSSSLTILITATKAGAVPIAALIHQFQTLENYAAAFELLKENFPNCFGGHETARIFMTDDSAAERGALKLVWPAATQLLCHFHVAQAEWRYLWGKNASISKEERFTLMKMFQKVMYASSAEEWESASKVILDMKEKFPRFVQRFNTMSLRKEEWVLFYRIPLVTRNHNTNNYCEASIRILKDVILSRTKAFNAVALAEFIISVWDTYLSCKLLDHAYGRNVLKGQIMYRSLCKTVKKSLSVKHLEGCFYEVESETREGASYVVNASVGVCTCPVGMYGGFCKHQFLVNKKKGVVLPNMPPVSQTERHALAVLAVGKEKAPQLSFFKSVGENQDIGGEVMDVSDGRLESITQTTEAGPNPETTASDTEKKEFFEEVKRWETLCGGFPNGSIKSLCEAMKTCKSQEDVLKALRSATLAISSKTKGRFGKKIKVQPTSIARRRMGITRGSARLPQGRPLNGLKTRGVKRKHNFGENLKLNQPNAKSHGSAH